MQVKQSVLAGFAALVLAGWLAGPSGAQETAAGGDTAAKEKTEPGKAAGKAGKAEKAQKERQQLSPEERAKRQEKMKEKLKMYAAGQAKRIEQVQARLDELNAEAAAETVSVWPPSAAILGVAPGKAGKGRSAHAMAASRRQKMRKNAQDGAPEIEQADPMEIKVPNSDELRAALASVTEAQTKLIAALTKQKEGLDQTLAELDRGSDGQNPEGKANVRRRGFGGEGAKEAQEAQAVAGKAGRELALLKAKLWLASVPGKLRTEDAKSGATSAQAAFDGYLAVQVKLAALQQEMATHAQTFEEALKSVTAELSPKRPEKREKGKGDRERFVKEGKGKREGKKEKAPKAAE